jgi:aspartyl-tRNA(Asn)/glutamyl-tRNA(Gln) amidotransferase subunit A
MALGTDTGGSVRCPAAFCGVVGIKPTYGLVSRYGVVAYANSLEQVGPVARNVPDAALLLDVIAGGDPKDSTSVAEADKVTYTDHLVDDVKGLTIGVPDEFFGEGLDKRVEKLSGTAS